VKVRQLPFRDFQLWHSYLDQPWFKIRRLGESKGSRKGRRQLGTVTMAYLPVSSTRNETSPMFFSITQAISSHNGSLNGWVVHFHTPSSLRAGIILSAGFDLFIWQALVFVREFVLGSNRNGSVVSNGTIGVTHSLVDDILPGETNAIFTGSGTTLGSTIWPSATIAAWDSFISTATVTAAPSSAGNNWGI
jgi:hypothetical protein